MHYALDSYGRSSEPVTDPAIPDSAFSRGPRLQVRSSDRVDSCHGTIVPQLPVGTLRRVRSSDARPNSNALTSSVLRSGMFQFPSAFNRDISKWNASAASVTTLSLAGSMLATSRRALQGMAGTAGLCLGTAPARCVLGSTMCHRCTRVSCAAQRISLLHTNQTCALLQLRLLSAGPYR